MRSLRVACPAKVNLFLAVGPLDERGYHPIRTTFQSVGLFDFLEIRISGQADQITSNWEALPEENTLTKALRLARELLPIPPLAIHLVKNIPAESGLGGGSSDAAGLLRGLNLLLSPPPSSGFLMDVASVVGKDVPFFLVGGRARGEGYGERLTPLEDGDTVWFVIAKPEVGCSTLLAYKRLDEQPRAFLDFDEPGLYNDFERVAPCESLEYLDVLQSYGASGALLCGSGSAVFGVFEDEMEARRAARRLSEDSRVHVFLAPSLNRSESLRIEAN